jgi:hypothetical protein
VKIEHDRKLYRQRNRIAAMVDEMIMTNNGGLQARLVRLLWTVLAKR